MFGIVVNQEGFKIDFFVLNEDKTPQGYVLKDGEQVIEDGWRIANTMNKPKWDGSKWIDTEPLPIVETPIKEVDKIDILEQENEKLKNKLATVEQATLETGATQQELIEILIELGVM